MARLGGTAMGTRSDGRHRLVLLLLGCLLVAACAPASVPARQGEDTQTAPQAAPIMRTLVIASRNEPPTLASKPLRFVAAPRGIGSALFNATLDFLDERGTAHPYLADGLPQLNTESWRVSPDGRMQTMYRLKPNLVWHDSTPLSASDFVFAWHVYRTPELGVASGLPIIHMEELLAPDERTLVIRWKTPYPLAGVLKDEFQALPRHVLESAFQSLDPESFTNHAFWAREYVGLGPYRLDRWEPGTFYEATAFDYFVFGRPKIERVQVRFMNDPNTVLANILAGEVHISVDYAVRFEQGATLRREWASRGERDGGVVVASPTLFWKTNFQFRPEIASPKAILDMRVRRALAHAVDKQGINEALMGGLAVVTDTIVAPRGDYYPAVERAIAKYPYDPRLMQQRLEEAGFRRGADGFYVGPDGEPFTPDLRVTADPTQEAENAIIVDTLRRAGVNATSYIIPAAQQQDGQVRSLFPTMATSGGSGGEAELQDYRTAAISTPENRFNGRNRGAWSSAEYDRLWETFNTTLDRPTRIQQIVELQRILTDEMPLIPHFFTPQITPHVAALRGPVAREVPDAILESYNVYRWEWQF